MFCFTFFLCAVQPGTFNGKTYSIVIISQFIFSFSKLFIYIVVNIVKTILQDVNNTGSEALFQFFNTT